MPDAPKWVTLAALTALIVAGVFLSWRLYRIVWARTVIIIDNKQLTTRHRLKTPEMIAGALKEHNLTLSEKDIVLPPVSSPFSTTITIRVLRVTEKIEKVTETAGFKVLWRKKYKDNLRPVELQKGVAERIRKDVRITYQDGVEVTRQVLRRRSTKKTIYRVCLLDKKGNIETTYDLSSAKKMRMLATAYYPGDPLAWRDGTITFLGQKMQRGIVAVDPSVIPLRTRLYIPGFGYGFAGDTGSAIKKHRIDLGVNDAEEEKSWMHRWVTVYVLEKADTW